jgi:NADPH-dependent glutamate synthase beta subunit-like oxidoreductase
VIGSGPAGLTAAYFLALKGYRITVFEKLPVSGGMMAVGIPEYRLPRNILETEINIIKDTGVEIQNGINFGLDITLGTLRKNGYAAVVLATGLHLSRPLNLPGKDLKGIYQGVDFLRKISLGQKISFGKQVLIIGGGNVAIDVARTTLRLGARNVSLVCLESSVEMPAWKEEIEEALEEGVNIINGWGPSRFLGEKGQVKSVEFKRCLSVFDENGKFNPVLDEKEITVFGGDSVIIAIGQSADLSFAAKEKIQATDMGRVKVDPETLETPLPGIFAAGDIAKEDLGTVIEAIASGRKVAISIDKYLGGDGILHETSLVFKEAPILSDTWLPPGERCNIPHAPTAERISNFAETYGKLTEENALSQTKRCFRCDLPLIINSAKCCGCLSCELRCSFRKTGSYILSAANIKIRRLVGKETEFNVYLSEECDNCGLCVRYCPYGALTRAERRKG